MEIITADEFAIDKATVNALLKCLVEHKDFYEALDDVASDEETYTSSFNNNFTNLMSITKSVALIISDDNYNSSISQAENLDLRDLLTDEHDASKEGIVNNLTSYLYFDNSSSSTNTVTSSNSAHLTTELDSTKVDKIIAIATIDLIETSIQQQIIDDVIKQQVSKFDI